MRKHDEVDLQLMKPRIGYWLTSRITQVVYLSLMGMSSGGKYIADQ